MAHTDTPRQRVADAQASCRYLLTWDPALLGWVLTYSGQTVASVSAYLPGRPALDHQAAQAWADDLIGPQQWQTIHHNHAYVAEPKEAERARAET